VRAGVDRASRDAFIANKKIHFRLLGRKVMTGPDLRNNFRLLCEKHEILESHQNAG
jgi:hypothetical protein